MAAEPLLLPGGAIWMPTALGELGITEIAGPEHHARILEYHATTTLKATRDEVAWCSSFANWTFVTSGIEGTNSAAARSWLDWGIPIEEPIYGCVAVFSRGSSSWSGHVCFFTKDTSHLGGNQSNMVKFSEYSDRRLLGYRWPAVPES